MLGNEINIMTDIGVEQFALLASLLIFAGFVLVPVSRRIGAPILLLVLLAGMLAGEDGPGGLQFADFSAAYSVGSIALAIILFAGGIETRTGSIKAALAPAILLSTIGVVVTAGVLGLCAHLILGVPLEYALLLGAVVGSTDAASTFLLIQQSRTKLSQRLSDTLTLESGLNDPVAIFATLAMTSVVNAGHPLSGGDFVEFLPMLTLQLGVGTLIGLVTGYCLSLLIGRIQLSEGLYPPMILSAAMAVYFGTTLLQGSGFLAIYLCGLMIALNGHMRVSRIRQFSEGLQWLSQIALFLMLGLLVTPSTLEAAILPALAFSALLIFVARPVAVLVCAAPLKFKSNETAFLSWVGLRGAVPIFLAIFPVITPGPVGVEFFNTVFVVVVVSLVLQGWTISPIARLLKLDTPLELKAAP